MSPANIAQFRGSHRPGNGDGIETRLRTIERDIAEVKKDVASLEDRLRAVEIDIREIKTQLKHVATKAWILGGVLGGMGIAAGIALAVARLFSSSP